MYIKFLGSGNSHSEDLGESSFILSLDKINPLLVVDYGYNNYFKIKSEYGFIKNIFITHTHFDHIGGLEKLFYERIFKKDEEKIKIFCNVNLVPLLLKKLNYPNQIAESGVNFFDAFHLIPVENSFWIDGLEFTVFENRHHQPKTSYGLFLKGKFLYTGDTRPIPEIISIYANSNELIFHDCAENSNPSHSGLDDILREYDQRYINRMFFYHLNSLKFKEYLIKKGFNVINNNDWIKLN